MTVPEGFVRFWLFGKDVLWMTREKFDQWKAFYGLERFPLYRVTERRTARTPCGIQRPRRCSG